MHRDDEDTLVTDPMVDAIDDGDTPANGTPPLSVLERLKARRGELAETRTFDLEVPGTGGLLVLRLGVLPRQRLAALTQRATKGGAEADLNLNADTLIAATRNVLARNHPCPSGPRRGVRARTLPGPRDRRLRRPVPRMGERRRQRARRGVRGGIAGSAEVKMAAFMATRGLPALRYLTTGDDTERLVFATVAREIAVAEEREARKARG
jgi:hypothetical protein